ncbi:amino acid/polyamine transporter I [Scleroderma citrinum]
MSRTDERARRDAELLARLGYKQELKHVFTPLEVFGIAFTTIGLFSSMLWVVFIRRFFLVYGLPNDGPVAMVWGWAVASIFILCCAMSIAELASAAPTAGGVYFWTYSFASPRWRSLLCWIVGYANTIAWISGVASVDWACAVQITAAASISSGQTYIATNAQTYGIYVAILLSHGLVCSLPTTILARVQHLYIATNIYLCLAVIVGFPIVTHKQNMNNARFALTTFKNLNSWPDSFSFVLSLLYPLWTISGLDPGVHISEEAFNAAVIVPWAILSRKLPPLRNSVNLSLTFCMDTNIENILSSPIGQPMAEILFSRFGQKGTLGLWSFVGIAQYIIFASGVLAASRQVFAFSRDGVLPLSSILSCVNKTIHAPINAVWFVVITTAPLGLLVFAGAQAISAVFSVTLNAFYIAYSVSVAARWLGNSTFKPGPFHLGRYSLPISTIAVLFMIFMNVVFLFPTTPNTSAIDMNYTVVVLGALLVLSLVWYYLPVYGAMHWFTGPVRNIGDESELMTQVVVEGCVEKGI